jgi:hypothetical protein
MTRAWRVQPEWFSLSRSDGYTQVARETLR